MADIIIVRHGIAEDCHPRGDEHRALTPKGRERVERMGRIIHSLFESVDVIISSNLVRAIETAQCFVDVYPGAVVYNEEELHPVGAASDALSAIARIVPSEGTAVVVGHQPNLSALISLALSGDSRPFVDVARGSATHLFFPGPVGPGRGILGFMLRNRVVEAIR